LRIALTHELGIDHEVTHRDIRQEATITTPERRNTSLCVGSSRGSPAPGRHACGRRAALWQSALG
jgi:hypothetical protein